MPRQARVPQLPARAAEVRRISDFRLMLDHQSRPALRAIQEIYGLLTVVLSDLKFGYLASIE
jgi:hypothetical protein